MSEFIVPFTADSEYEGTQSRISISSAVLSSALTNTVMKCEYVHALNIMHDYISHN